MIGQLDLLPAVYVSTILKLALTLLILGLTIAANRVLRNTLRARVKDPAQMHTLYMLLRNTAFAAGAIATVYVLSLHPRYFYRRLVYTNLLSGLGLNALGFAIDVFAETPFGRIDLRWSGSAAWSFNLFWLGALAVLVYADLKTRSGPTSS